MFMFTRFTKDNIGGLSSNGGPRRDNLLIHYAYARPGMKLLETIQTYKEDGLKKLPPGLRDPRGLFDAAAQVQEIPKAFELGVTFLQDVHDDAKLKWMTDDYT